VLSSGVVSVVELWAAVGIDSLHAKVPLNLPINELGAGVLSDIVAGGDLGSRQAFGRLGRKVPIRCGFCRRRFRKCRLLARLPGLLHRREVRLRCRYLATRIRGIDPDYDSVSSTKQSGSALHALVRHLLRIDVEVTCSGYDRLFQ